MNIAANPVSLIDQLLSMHQRAMNQDKALSLSDINATSAAIQSVANDALGVSPATRALDDAIKGESNALEQQLSAQHSATAFMGSEPKVSSDIGVESSAAQSASVMQQSSMGQENSEPSQGCPIKNF